MIVMRETSMKLLKTILKIILYPIFWIACIINFFIGFILGLLGINYMEIQIRFWEKIFKILSSDKR